MDSPLTWQVDPSLDMKRELTERGISCLLDYGQASRFLVRNSGLHENLTKAAKNFASLESTINSTGEMIAQMGDIMADLKAQSERIEISVQQIPSLYDGLSACHDIIKIRAKDNQPLSKAETSSLDLSNTLDDLQKLKDLKENLEKEKKVIEAEVSPVKERHSQNSSDEEINSIIKENNNTGQSKEVANTVPDQEKKVENSQGVLTKTEESKVNEDTSPQSADNMDTQQQASTQEALTSTLDKPPVPEVGLETKQETKSTIDQPVISNAPVSEKQEPQV